MVRGLSGGQDNALAFGGVDIPAAGEYFITVSYFALNDRGLTYRLNEAPSNTYDILASGPWCYQGGAPADFTFAADFQAGTNELLFYDSPIIDKIVIASDTAARPPTAFYVSASMGDDLNDGLSPDAPLLTLNQVNALSLVPGDSLFFRAGDTFHGELVFQGESGSEERPIIVGRYGDGPRPVLEGDGYLSAVRVVNSGYLHFSGLEIGNDGGPPQTGEPTNLRYGMYLENTLADGTTFKHFHLDDLTFRNIYPTDQITDDDQTGVHAYALNTSGSWGDETHPTRFEDMRIENCLFTRTGRHALRVLATDELVIRNNLFEQVGGAGMFIGANCSNILVEYNTTDHTGSSIDPRMAGRGSGIWCFRTRNLVVQHNKFMHARGIKDSYGMHIDIGNRNVVYQYNYSENNEGGFVEILGANVNVGYRYNLSVGDGWRSRGNQLGRIFWIGGWSGNPSNPVGSDSVFIYNNSIFVRDTIEPRIWIEAVTQNTRIQNNIIYAPNGLAEVFIKNDPAYNDFDHNLWYGPIPTTDTDGQPYRGPNAQTLDPLFVDRVITDSSGFLLQTGSPALNSGQIIYDPAFSGPYDYYHRHGGVDFFGNEAPTDRPPGIGAYNGPGVVVSSGEVSPAPFRLFPNPVRMGRDVFIEVPARADVRALSVQFLDLTGRVLLEGAYSYQHRLRVETGSLTPGCYLIRVRADGYQRTEKVLVF